jgi:hypothetical protein
MRFLLALPAVLALSASLLAAEEQAVTFAAVKDAVAANRLQKSTTIGKGGRDTFSETTGQPSVLIGFEFGLGKNFKTEVIYALRAIYLTADGPRLGPAHGVMSKTDRSSKVTRTVTVQAKAGYAVGGITGRAPRFLNGVSLRFQRIDGTKLDGGDSYQSEWVGDRTGGSEVSIDTQGLLPVGIHGKTGAVECMSLGLIHLTPPEPAVTATPEPAAPVQPVPQPQETPVTRPEPEKRAEKPASPKAAAVARAAPAKEASDGGWALPAALGLLVAVLGVGGVMMFTHSKQPVTEQAGLPEKVSAAEPCINLLPDVEERVRAELVEGEHLIWAGQPSHRATRFNTLTTMGICLGIALLGGAVATVMLLGKGGSTIIPLTVLTVFGLIGVGGTILVPIHQQRMARRTGYAVTNRRAIVLRPSPFGPVAIDSYGPVQLQQMVRRDWWVVKGAGDLIFHTEKTLVVTTTHSRGGSSSSAREKIVHFGFLGIDEPGRIEKVVRQVLVNPLVDKIQA